MAHPGPHGGRRGRVTQFLRDSRWEKYLFEQARQEINLTNLDQIADRTGVRDDQAHQKPRRRKSARSRSRSSTV
ncbi:hypothetical protein SBA6_1070013 [Candidatus Sulfopaludibacter sp. SbA6]|nr:hypothetical protein SBA6_1070013 [Candidatus Sulfopaludibacter sp. SbA6]